MNYGLNFLAANLADAAAKLGKTIGKDDWLRRLILKVSDNEDFLKLAAFGIKQSGNAFGAALESALQDRGFSDDQADFIVRAVIGFLTGFSDGVKELNLTEDDREGLLRKLNADLADYNVDWPDSVAPVGFTDEVAARMRAEINDDVEYVELLDYKDRALGWLLEWSQTSDHPQAIWAEVVSDHPNFSQVNTNIRFARMAREHHRGWKDLDRKTEEGRIEFQQRFDAMCVSLVAILRATNPQALESKVSGYRFNRFLADGTKAVKDLPDKLVEAFKAKILPVAFVLWGAGGILLLGGLGMFVWHANRALHEAAAGDMYAMWSSLFWCLVAILFPYSMGVQVAAGPTTVAEALARQFQVLLSALPFVDPPEPKKIPDDSRELGPFAHQMLVWRWTAIAVLFGYGYMVFTGHVTLFDDSVTVWSDWNLVAKYLLLGGLILRIAWRSDELTKNPKIKRFIGWSAVGTGAAMALITGVTALSLVLQVQKRAVLSWPILELFGGGAKLGEAKPVEAVAMAVFWICALVLVLAVVAVVLGVWKDKRLSFGALGVAVAAMLLAFGSAVLVQYLVPETPASAVHFQDRYDDMGVKPLGTPAAVGAIPSAPAAPAPAANPVPQEASKTIMVGGVAYPTAASAWD